MKKSNLTVLSPPAREVLPESVVEAFKSSSPRAVLWATGLRVASYLDRDSTQARDMASLSKRLMEIVRELNAEEARERKEGGKRNGSTLADAPFDATAV